jgi:hypothetical protein
MSSDPQDTSQDEQLARELQRQEFENGFISLPINTPLQLIFFLSGFIFLALFLS